MTVLPEEEWKDTVLGLLKRTGPASAQLLDQETGDVYNFDFDEAAKLGMSGISGKEWADSLFSDGA